MRRRLDVDRHWKSGNNTSFPAVTPEAPELGASRRAEYPQKLLGPHFSISEDIFEHQRRVRLGCLIRGTIHLCQSLIPSLGPLCPAQPQRFRKTYWDGNFACRSWSGKMAPSLSEVNPVHDAEEQVRPGAKPEALALPSSAPTLVWLSSRALSPYAIRERPGK